MTWATTALKVLSGGILQHSGTDITWQAGNIQVDNAATILNTASSRFIFSAGASNQISRVNGLEPTFENYGIISKTNANINVVALELNNRGTIEVTDGTLQFTTSESNQYGQMITSSPGIYLYLYLYIYIYIIF